MYTGQGGSYGITWREREEEDWKLQRKQQADLHR